MCLYACVSCASLCADAHAHITSHKQKSSKILNFKVNGTHFVRVQLWRRFEQLFKKHRNYSPTSDFDSAFNWMWMWIRRSWCIVSSMINRVCGAKCLNCTENGPFLCETNVDGEFAMRSPVQWMINKQWSRCVCARVQVQIHKKLKKRKKRNKFSIVDFGIKCLRYQIVTTTATIPIII